MKTFLILIVWVEATYQSGLSQIKKEFTKYGFEISQFISSSGFQPGYEAHFTVQPSNKAKVGFGLFLDTETKRFSGITITHQRMFMSNRRNLPVFQPFMVYNFIYRRTTTPEIVEKDGFITTGDYFASYASMEHHLGLGMNINISKNMYIDSSLGYGLYLGSIKKPSNPDPITHEISGTSGDGIIFKMGLGIHL